jgi:hypothetical protein
MRAFEWYARYGPKIKIDCVAGRRSWSGAVGWPSHPDLRSTRVCQRSIGSARTTSHSIAKWHKCAQLAWQGGRVCAWHTRCAKRLIREKKKCTDATFYGWCAPAGHPTGQTTTWIDAAGPTVPMGRMAGAQLQAWLVECASKSWSGSESQIFSMSKRLINSYFWEKIDFFANACFYVYNKRVHTLSKKSMKMMAPEHSSEHGIVET